MDDNPRYWHAAKRFLLGCRLPLTWEGWLVDVFWLAAFIGISQFVRERRHPFQSLGLAFGLFALLPVIRHWDGEPQRWND